MDDTQVVTESHVAGFSQYGQSFQEKVIQAMLHDHRWATQVSEVLKSDYFDKKYLQFLCDRLFAYNKKYKCFPSLSILVTLIKDELRVGMDVVLRESIISYIKRIANNPDVADLVYVKEKALDFCRRQAMKDALEASIDLIHDGKYDSVVSTLKIALAVGTMPSVGHKFFDEIDARLTEISRNCVPTGISQLDDKLILNGGLGKGELGVVTANTGVGKSHFLIQVGANAIKSGRIVVHYSFELSEKYVGIRYDSNFCDIPASDVIENKNQIKLKYKEMRASKKVGRLFVKEYPANSCSVVTIRNHLEKLEITEGVRPDLIIVDYADIMKSTRAFDAQRHELKLIYEELRSLAQELAVPIWTGSQAHRDSAKAEIVGLENMAEAYSKAMVADFVLSLSRKPLEKSLGVGRMFIAKNRMGKDGIVFPMLIDTSKSMITVSDAMPISVESIREGDNNDLKRALSKKWAQVKSEKELNVEPIA